MRSASFVSVASSVALLVAACSSSSSTPGASADDGGAPDAAGDGGAGSTYADGPLKGCTRDPGAPAVADTTGKDPTGGAEKFTLDAALAGYPAASGALVALITTEKGTIKCTLAEKDAPVSVANFVGLARGTRPYLDGSTWKAKRFYDGLTWHRVIPNFVIQGGDPLGNGTGGPGYDLPVENQVDEPAGTLAMAAAAVPSGSQFYIVVGQGPAANYNVFGTCETETAIAIAGVDRNKDTDMPTTPIHMTTIDIARCPR